MSGNDAGKLLNGELKDNTLMLHFLLIENSTLYIATNKS